MGKAIATRLAIEGASVVIADVNENVMDATVSELTAAGHKAGYKVDVSKRSKPRT